MCNPVAIYVGASLAMSAMQANAQSKEAKFQSEISEVNAKISENAADDAINRGNIEAGEQRRRTRQLAGTQAASISAGGGDLSTAGSLDILGDTAAMGELDALTMVNNASREAYGLRTQAMNHRLQGEMARQQGKAGVKQTLLTSPLKAYGTAGGAWNPFGSSSSSANSVGKSVNKSPKKGGFF